MRLCQYQVVSKAILSALSSAIQINSTTGNRFETLAEGEIPKPEIYESHKALVDAADN